MEDVTHHLSLSPLCPSGSEHKHHESQHQTLHSLWGAQTRRNQPSWLIVDYPALFKSVVDTLGEVTELLFTGGPSALIHNSSFWTTFFHSLMFDMSSGLLVRSGGHQKSEAEVRQELISPLLRRVAHCMSSVVAPEGWNGGPVYSSALNVETNTESRPRIPGAKPRVDYMLVGHVTFCTGYLLKRRK